MEHATRDFNILLTWGVLVGAAVAASVFCAAVGNMTLALVLALVTVVAVLPLNGFIEKAAEFRAKENGLIEEIMAARK